MNAWTLDDLRRLDLKYANEGIHFHQRPLRAARELLCPTNLIDFLRDPEVARISEAYARIVPEVRENWPGSVIGLAASADRVRKLTLPVIYGQQSLEPWQLARISHQGLVHRGG